MSLVNETCIPCTGNEPRLHREVEHELLKQTPGWVLKEKSMWREFKFVDFRQALAFVNKVAQIAEQAGHHPDIHVYYNRVVLELSTHAVDGLTRNDFIVAAKIDQLEGMQEQMAA